MAAKTIELKINVSLEIDEERLREMFEDQEIKFTKKKAVEIIDDFENGFDQDELNELFEEMFVSFLAENYGE
jgi:hypothetical protein